MKFNGMNLNDVVKAHKLHLDRNIADRNCPEYEGVEPSLADFSSMRIEDTKFCGKDLGFADFSDSIFINCNFSGARMYYANMKHCHFYKCKFCGTDLHGSYMQHTVFDMCMFNSANLCYADANSSRFYRCNFKKASINDSTDFTNADMDMPKNMPYIPMVCPEEGEFIGWKKCYYAVESTIYGSDNIKGCIVKLKIPAHALRSSSLGRKCRASEAIVLAIQDLHGKDLGVGVEAFSEYDMRFKYHVGETVKPRRPSFDPDRWRECSAGIHFFINRREAVRY
jgi:hypothetical protein